MEAVILVIHLIVAVAIIITILLQPSEAGGFVGNSGSMSNLMVQRRSGNVLTRATTILAGIFFLTSIILAISAGRQPAHKSILEMDAGGQQTKIEQMQKIADDIAPEAPIGGAKPAVNKKEAAPAEKPAANKDAPAKKPAQGGKSEPEAPTGR